MITYQRNIIVRSRKAVIMFAIVAGSMLIAAMASANNAIDRESETLDILTRIDAFSESDPRLIEDSGKAHYNMGNIYFQKGEYEIAAREYYQAAMLLPDDPDVHYNLAYVSADYLDDYETALKHFKMYLYLNPKAKDIKYIKEKIVEATLHIRSKVDSKLEEK